MKRVAPWAGAVALASLWMTGVQQAQRPALAATGAEAFSPPALLSQTGLYVDGRGGQAAPANRYFTPQYPLWTDGLQKRRWVYLPPDAASDVTDEHAWDYPVGTRFWREFSLGSRPVETRLLWKASAAGTDAVLAPDGGVRNVIDVAPGRRHSIPSRTDCTTCHGSANTRPLGFNALQLSTDRDPNALHAEPLQPGMLTLQTLEEEGLLSPSRPDLVSQPPRRHRGLRPGAPDQSAIVARMRSRSPSSQMPALGTVVRDDAAVNAVALWIAHQR